ncbi:MAG: ABC transporter permease [Betaproteobacteria bacterium]
MSVAPGVRRSAWDNMEAFASGVSAVIELETRKLAHDPTEVITRTVQPLLWLLVFGQVFGRLRGVSTGGLPYLDYLAPGVLGQSVVFVSIFFGLSIIWERDAGTLHKLLTAPIPRAALVLGKSLSAAARALAQVVIILAVAALLGVHFHWGVLPVAGSLLTVVLGAAVFSGLSMILACLMRSRERFMGIGQVVTMPLFFASNALYPLQLMPHWLRVIAIVNPMSFIVDALRSLLLGTPGHVYLDLGALALFTLGFTILGAHLFQRLVA